MTMKKSYLVLMFFALLGASSCDPDKDMVKATVINSGDITNRGCGYVLELEDHALLQPNYLPGAYQHDGLKVKVSFEHTGIQDTCKFGSVLYDLVDIKDIKNDRSR